jgi:phenylalanine-4-hydroxylase
MVIAHENKPIFFQTVGATALAYREKELVGHSIEKHANGFGSPIGKLKGINLAIEDMSPRDLKAYNIYEGETISLEFDGNISIEGEIITGTRNLSGEIILVNFKNCTVRHKDAILFESQEELYNMAIGQNIVSAFNGPADLNSFDLVTHEISETTIKSQKDAKSAQLEQLYQQIRDFREGKNTTISRNKVFKEVAAYFPEDWLLCVELYELAKMNPEVQKEQVFALAIKTHLEMVKQDNPELGHLIDDGLAIVHQKLVT